MAAADVPANVDVDKTVDDFEPRFFRAKHEEYLASLEKKTDNFEFHITEHLRMSGVYWGAMAMSLLGKMEAMFAGESGDRIIQWVLACQHECGGFGGNLQHDPHILYTLSAVQILVLTKQLHRVDGPKIARYVVSLQQPDGSFAGDEYGEIDTRFSYCALNCLAVLNQLDTANVKAATDFVARCRNFDGGFGAVPGAESHSGQIFCCVAALAIGDALHHVDSGLLGWWLCERQLPCGGLNGRPEKKEDVCYSWWVLSALAILRKISWIDRKMLGDFILTCQDDVKGGISDRPGNMVDVFHTFFGFAGLSLLGYPGFETIDPVYALPQKVVTQLGLAVRYSAN